MSIIERTVSSPSILQMVFGDGTPKKAILTALVVGTILTTINHGDIIMDGLMPDAWKVFLMYCVTTWGAATGKLAQWRRDTRSQLLFIRNN